MKKNIQRTYIPGSEWIYFKLYTGSSSADKILIHVIPRIISKLEANNQIVKWFFIRYQDPDFHLRIRFLVRNPSELGEVMVLFNTYLHPYIQDNIIWKMQIDTYKRELERYKAHLIEPTESLFHLDSSSMVSILKILDKTPGENLRWMISMKMIDDMLNNFRYTLPRKQQLLERMDHSFKSEFGYNEFNGKQLNQMYRQYSKNMSAVIEEKDPSLLLCYRLLYKRSVALQKTVNEIITADKKNESDYLIPNYIHMTMNRMFRSRNRIYELIIYNFLNRYYRSQIARMKSSVV